MTHFAEIDSDGIVIRVIVAEQDFIDSEVLGPKENWIQTSYNTKHGVHRKGKTPLRKNFAGIGFKYDKVKDVFIRPKPHTSWILNNEKADWEAPIPLPDKTNHYFWEEHTQTWRKIIIQSDIL